MWRALALGLNDGEEPKVTDAASIVYPGNATLDKDTGFQGYEPAGILTAQPKKNRKARP